MEAKKRKFFNEDLEEVQKIVQENGNSLNISDHWEIFAAATRIDADDNLLKMIFLSGAKAAFHVDIMIAGMENEEKAQEVWNESYEINKREFLEQLSKVEELLEEMLGDDCTEEDLPVHH